MTVHTVVIGTLLDQRRTVSEAWERYISHGVLGQVSSTVAQSWSRSRERLGTPVDAAPGGPNEDVYTDWRSSSLRPAVEMVGPDIADTAAQGDLVAAVTDGTGRILWTAGSVHMRDRASAVNFAPGGRWDEASVGTNALDLALRSGRAQTVFSAEHFSPCVHNWVCYAAPVRDPGTGQVVGVLDLSTTWDKSHPMALVAASAFAASISRLLSVPASVEHAAEPLHVQVMGGSRLTQGGTSLLMTQRQAEIVLAFALHPEGLTLDALHAHVYGDEAVSVGTLRSEVSRLRRTIGPALASRPYRLTVPVTVDAVVVLDLVRRGDAAAAARAFAGAVLPRSEAPVVRDLSTRVEVALRQLVLGRADLDATCALAERRPDDLEVIQHGLRLARPGTSEHAMLTAAEAAALAD